MIEYKFGSGCRGNLGYFADSCAFCCRYANVCVSHSLTVRTINHHRYRSNGKCQAIQIKFTVVPYTWWCVGVRNMLVICTYLKFVCMNLRSFAAPVYKTSKYISMNTVNHRCCNEPYSNINYLRMCLRHDVFYLSR